MIKLKKDQGSILIEKEKCEVITLPLPPTDNRLRKPATRKVRSKRTGKIGYMAILVPTDEYVDWKETVNILWGVQYARNVKPVTPSFENQVSIDYRLYLPDRRTDIQNYNKALNDFLKDKAFTDDKWVKLNLVLPVQIDKNNPRVEIFVENNG